MKNWKTTLCGALAALGAYFITVPELAVVGKIMVPLATALTGFFAADASSTDQK